MSRKRPPKVRTSVSLPPELLARMVRASGLVDVNWSEIAEGAFRRVIARMEKAGVKTGGNSS